MRRAADSRYFSRDRRTFLILPPGAILSSAPSLNKKMADALEPHVLSEFTEWPGSGKTNRGCLVVESVVVTVVELLFAGLVR